MSAVSRPQGARPRVLVTGGAGFIGSHTCVELIQSGYDVIAVDDLSAGSAEALDRVHAITGVLPILERVDVTDRHALATVFERHSVDAIIHFAARKAVGESTEIPLSYFHTNVAGTATLLAVAKEAGVTRIVFSSSCSVYGETRAQLLDETAPIAPTNPYAWSKHAAERMIDDGCRYHSDMRAISLRYFNPIGAHPSGLLGEVPVGTPRNVIPYLAQVAGGQRERLNVFGADYPTADGSAVRDYVHVVDIARGHVDALDHIDDHPGMQVFNLGTGEGTSVLELRAAFIEACGRDIPYTVLPRRPGDVPRLVADAGSVREAWGWKPQLDLAAMCRDSWNFQVANPRGYADAGRP
ncbi:MAG TPA: UDP-glucose 4-epimerase GalE [Flexivirga sp.]|uniref:UDP-glucose 4-epimerase GalE n=1 Tax=Flexivirga sp. TaxID=1962927 RepID=UPI002C5FBADB|nr:UDP-glucose 4-epimerase GalE [Flexivirga sp.]HWC23355.1 UDP-glucose 4-epimerase GalE [Flexivirga sp.]